MKKIVCFLLFTLLISCYYQNINPSILNTECCETECNKEILPSFPPIDNNENVVFFDLSGWYTNILVAIDTSNDKVIQKYNFDKYSVAWLLFNRKISNKVYIFSESSYFLILDPASGNVSKKKTNYPIMDIVFLGNKILLQKNWVTFKGVPVECNLYNISTDSFEDYTIPGGSIGTYIDQNIVFGNNAYLPTMYDSSGELDNRNPTVYNITSKKVLDFFPERNYTFFHFVGDRYLYAYKAKTYLVDIYEVESFEPVNAKIIHSQAESDEDIIGLRIFEDEDYLYIFDQSYGNAQITKRRKSDYAIVDKKIITNNHQRGAVPYFMNNHFWIVALDYKGAYKINKDLEITVVK